MSMATIGAILTLIVFVAVLATPKLPNWFCFFDYGTDRCIYRNNGCRRSICRVKQFKFSSDGNYMYVFRNDCCNGA